MIDKSAIQRAHPEWNIVDAVEAIDGSGGIWALGANGAVFAFDAQGNPSPTGAKYFGSYTGLAPEQRQGDRSFVKIVTDTATGGYTLISNQVGQNYTFKGDRDINQKVDTSNQPAPTKAIDFTEADQNRLTAMLNQYGLGDLVNEAWTYFKDPTKGAGDTQATLDYLPTTDAYQRHFPGLKEMAAKGNAWTPGQWNDYYNAIQDEAVAAGIPADLVDREDIGKMLRGGVSRTEAVGRIRQAGQSALNADPVVLQKMHDLGFSDGDIKAFYLEPDKATSLLERKAQEGQARIAAAAQRTGFDPALSGRTAKDLQLLGVDEQAAQQGFGELYDTRHLFENTIGETGQITTQEQLGATFGNDKAAQEEIERRRAGRGAMFQGGGGAASGGAGKQGLG